MPKPAMPPRGQRKSELPGVLMVLGAIAGVVMIVGIATVFLKRIPTPPQGLELGHRPKAELIDFTGALRYGRDESTGLCFVYSIVISGISEVPCEALERLR